MFGWITKLYNSWIAVPLPVRKAIQGAVVSYQFSLINFAAALLGGYIVLANALHQSVTMTGFIQYIGSTWFATLAGLISAGYRARQGYFDAKSLPYQTGTSAALQQTADESRSKGN